MSTARHSEGVALSRERRTLGYAFGITALGVLVMLLGFLLPLKRERSRLLTEVGKAEQQLLEYWRQPTAPLDSQVEAAAMKQSRLEEEWDQLRRRIDTFGGQSPLTDALSSNDEGRIDFKIALYDARIQLREKASARGVSLPLDLGIEEQITADDDAETRRWQLAAIYQLANELIDLEVPVIERIELVPPVEYYPPPPSEELVREFSVRILMQVPPGLLSKVIERLRSEEAFFGLRRFRIEKRQWDPAAPLSVKLVCGASIFTTAAVENEPAGGGEVPFLGPAELGGPLLIEGEND